MTSSIPAVVQSILEARDDAALDAAWSEFLKQYSPLVLRVAHLLPGDHDSVMDRYLFVIDALRKDGCRKLRAYSVDGRGSFTTWLVAVSRRLCIDEHRIRYGRSRTAERTPSQVERSRLEKLEGGSALLDSIESALGSPDRDLDASELQAALSKAMMSLDVSDRLLLKLRYEDGLPAIEIARILREGSQFSIYRRLERILAAMRRELELAGIADRL